MENKKQKEDAITLFIIINPIDLKAVKTYIKSLLCNNHIHSQFNLAFVDS